MNILFISNLIYENTKCFNILVVVKVFVSNT